MPASSPTGPASSAGFYLRRIWQPASQPQPASPASLHASHSQPSQPASQLCPWRLVLRGTVRARLGTVGVAQLTMRRCVLSGRSGMGLRGYSRWTEAFGCPLSSGRCLVRYIDYLGSPGKIYPSDLTSQIRLVGKKPPCPVLFLSLLICGVVAAPRCTFLN